MSNDLNSASSDEPAQLVWFGQAALLKDFPEQYALPNMVKVVQGEYMNLAPKSEGKDTEKENELLIYSVEDTTKVLCVNLRVKDGRGVLQTENKLSIPLTYDGWFEVLSEDGRRVRPIESIRELARIFPHTCLVRKAITALVAQSDGSLSADSSRTVNPGETMTLFGLMQLNIGENAEPTKFLRCWDSTGNSLYFNQDQIGLFSPVAGKENISGVHKLKSILHKFHLPITCKLVHGSYPKNVDKDKFSGIVKILYVYDETHAFVCPASGQYRMIPIPAEVPMKVVPAVNFDEIRETPIISKVLDRCKSMVRFYQNSIHLLYDVEVLPPPKDGAAKPDDCDVTDDVKDPENDTLYKEVEDIYFYVVRHGVAPPAIPKRLYKEGEQDNDFWDQPIFKTLHRPRQRKSIVELTKDDGMKTFRFYEGGNQSRPLAYVHTGQGVGTPHELGQDPGKQRLVARRMSEQLEGAGDVKKPAKGRRKSQPAIFRFLFRGKDEGAGKGSCGSSDGSGGKGNKSKSKLSKLYL